MGLVPDINPLKPCAKIGSSMMRLELQENDVRHEKGSIDSSSESEAATSLKMGGAQFWN